MNSALDRLLKELPLAVSFATLGATNNLEGNIKARVFSSRTQSKDANNKAVKKGKGYSPSYAVFRKMKGRQTDYIDLQLTGNLLRSVNTVENINGAQIVFSNDTEADKAQELEDKIFKQDIFAATTEEATLFFDDFERLLFEQLENT